MALAIGSITAANVVFTLSVATLYTTPQSIQQFDVDDAVDSETVENAEVIKGVDGFMSAGWKPTLPKLNVTLMANSPSNAIFDNWFQQEQTNRTKYLAQGVISLPGIGTQFTLLNAYLMTYMHMPPVKGTLKARKHVLILDDIPYTPIAYG